MLFVSRVISIQTEGQQRVSNFPRVIAPFNPAASWDRAGPSTSRPMPSAWDSFSSASASNAPSAQQTLSSAPPGALNPAALAENPDDFWDISYEDSWSGDDEQQRRREREEQQ